MKSKILQKIDGILKCFTPSQPRWTVTQLAERLNLPVPTLHGLLADLVETDLLAFSPTTKEYSIGFRYMEMGVLHANNFELNNIALGVMNELVLKVDYLAGLCVLYKGWLYVSAIVMPTCTASEHKHMGPRVPAHITAAGRMILAHVPQQVLDRYLAAQCEGEKGFSAAYREELVRDLEDIRIRGYAIKKYYAVSKQPEVISAPVFGKNGQCLASLTLVSPADGFPEDRQDQLAEKLVLSTKEISMRCGHLAQTQDYV